MTELPTKPSWYLCHNGYAWELRPDGNWFLHGIPMTKEEARQVLPFRRLEFAKDNE